MRREYKEVRDYLAEAVSIESHTLKGQEKMADWLVDTLRRLSVGEVERVFISKDMPLGDADPPQSIITAYVGKKPERDVDECIVVEAHYDTVPPHGDYARRNINPYSLRPIDDADYDKADVFGGLGAADDKISIIQGMLSVRNVIDRIPSHRGVRLIFVGDEEDKSRSIYSARRRKKNDQAAPPQYVLPGLSLGEEEYLNRGHAITRHVPVQQSRDLFEYAKGAVSLEIKVEDTLNDVPALLVGRPDRIELVVTIGGKNSHTGGVDVDYPYEYLFNRYSRALQEIPEIRIPEDPRDYPAGINKVVVGVRRAIDQWTKPLHQRHVIMPRSKCVPTWGVMQKANGMSVSHQGVVRVDVLYSNAGLTDAAIKEYFESELRRRLGNDVPLTVTYSPERGDMPNTRPWREDVPNTPFIQHAYHIADKIHRRGKKGPPLNIMSAEPTADEAYFSNEKHHVPTVCVPPLSEKEHTAGEKTSLSGTADRQGRFVEAICTYPGSTTEMPDGNTYYVPVPAPITERIRQGSARVSES